MPPLRREIWVHLMLYPGHTLTTAAAPILVGTGLALHDGVFSPWPMLTAFLCSWFVHVGGVFVDVHELLARFPTVREHPELNDAVASGDLKLAFLWRVTLGWFVVALVPGIYLYQLLGPPAVALGIVGIAAATWYAAGKRPMAQLGLADPVFFVMFGVVAVAATYYVQAAAHGAPVPASAFFVGLPMAALVTNVLVIDDLRDVEFDRVKGWRTTPVRFGTGWSRRLHAALTGVAYAPLPWLAIVWGPWLLLPAVTLPLALLVTRRVWTAPHRELLVPWTPRAALLAMVYAALFGVGLALAST